MIEIKSRSNAKATVTTNTRSGVEVGQKVAAPKEGFKYASHENLWSGLTISYMTGDEGFRYQNGDFDSFKVENPKTIARLDTEAENPRETLVDNNLFGNKNRFTDVNGLQEYPTFVLPTSYSPSVSLIVDHYFGLIYVTGIGDVPTIDIFTNCPAVGAQITEYGYSDFSVMGIREQYQLWDQQNARWIGPINSDLTSIGSATPSSVGQSTFYPLYTNSDGRILWAGNFTKASAARVMFVKNVQEDLQKIQFTPRQKTIEILGTNEVIIPIGDLLINTVGENAEIVSFDFPDGITGSISENGYFVTLQPDIESDIEFSLSFTVQSENYSATGIINLKTFKKLFLDNNPTGSRALSFFKLRAKHDGGAVILREETNDTLLTIGFDSNGLFDEAAAIAHCNGARGFVHTIVDHSVFGLDFIQPDPTKQGLLVENGQVHKKNGRPSIRFDGIDDDYPMEQNPSIFGVWIVGAMYKDDRTLINHDTNGAQFGTSSTDANRIGWRDSSARTSSYNLGDQFISSNFDSVARSFFNGVEIDDSSLAGVRGGLGYINLGSRIGDYHADADFQFLVTFNDLKIDQWAEIDQILNDYFNTY